MGADGARRGRALISACRVPTFVSAPTQGVPMPPIKVSDASFQNDVLNAKGPVVVDFWAEWCGPCKMIAPALDELSTELNGKVTIAKINIDENPHVPQKYGVRGIPTMMIFSQGQVAATKVGALPKSKIKEWIESSIPESAARQA
jgi:thioredoxin 1